MGLDEDSDVEALLASGEADQDPRRTRVAPPAWTTVIIRGVELTLRRRPRGRGLLLPLEGPDLPATLGLLVADLNAADSERPSPAKRQRTDRQAVDLTEGDKGRVLWLASSWSWQVVWKDCDGHCRRTTKKFQVSEFDAAGRRLSADEREEARRVLLMAARRKWNELDRSTRARYSEDVCEAAEGNTHTGGAGR